MKFLTCSGIHKCPSALEPWKNGNISLVSRIGKSRRVRNESDEIKEPIVEVGETVKTTSEVADAYGVGGSAWIRDDVVNARDAASATQEASTAYSTAVADMMGDVNATLAAGIDYMAGVDIDDHARNPDRK